MQFLPVLKLKQEQLQLEILKVKRVLTYKQQFLQKKKQECTFIDLLPESLNIDLLQLLKIRDLQLESKSIAGVKVKALKSLSFTNFEPPIFGTNTWLSKAIPVLKTLLQLNVEVKIIKKQHQLLAKELKKANQKVNLFEKVLIPDTKEAISRIKIALSDEQVASVCRGKIAKNKVVTTFSSTSTMQVQL